MNGFIIAAVALAGTIGFALCWLGWQLLRQNGRILLRLDDLDKRLDAIEFGEPEPEGLALNSPAPEFELPDLDGKRRSLGQHRGQSVLVIFFNPACGFCRQMAPKLTAFLKAENGEQKAEITQTPTNAENSAKPPTLVVVSTGEAEANRQLFGEHPVGCPVLLQKNSEVANAYKANGTPTGYLIDAEGKVASQLAVGAEALLKLAEGKAATGGQEAGVGDERTNRFSNRSLARSKIKRDGLKAGTPAPDFRLPRLDGQGELGLAELHGRPALLVFSDPHCGPCGAVAPKLQKFHREHPEIGLVMISRGEPKDNRAKVKEHGLTFPIVLQRQWEISRLYAMFATPVAYLIDAKGIIVADAAVGSDPIVELMSRADRMPKPNPQPTPA
jgi:peroxiredoxin